MILFDIGEFCSSTASLLQFIGWALLIFKIAIPFVIIGYGMIDFGKAVVSEKDEDIKKSAKTLARRAIAGIVIFFIPTIVVWLFTQIPSFKSENKDDNTSGFGVCKTCLLHPGDCTAEISDEV